MGGMLSSLNQSSIVVQTNNLHTHLQEAVSPMPSPMHTSFFPTQMHDQVYLQQQQQQQQQQIEESNIRKDNIVSSKQSSATIGI